MLKDLGIKLPENKVLQLYLLSVNLRWWKNQNGWMVDNNYWKTVLCYGVKLTHWEPLFPCKSSWEYWFSYLHSIRIFYKLWNLSYFFLFSISTTELVPNHHNCLFIIMQVKSYEALNISIIKNKFRPNSSKSFLSLDISKISSDPKLNSKLFKSIFSIWKQ